MSLDSLLNSVKNSILEHVDQGGHKNFDSGGLLGKITDLFSNHSNQNPSSAHGAPRPAAEDPYGDPANEGRPNARGAVPRGADVKPASQDPYGDPADQGKPRR